ncbi:MAG: hypothetical protein JXR73_04320 [Candidatus Omnitrophica bacterium]|nr:hypothetical protein [Candidatus Omnitrophota bacterium]
MNSSIFRFVIIVGCFLHASQPFSYAERCAVIICGSGGEDAYQRKFTEWGSRLKTILIDRCQISQDNLFMLYDDSEASAHSISSLENINAVFSNLHDHLTVDDELFVFLIGHGSHLKDVSKFQIPGLDLTAQHLHELLQSIPSSRQIVINASSSSAGFINALSNSKRIICTATKSVEEKNATEFFEYFLQGLEQKYADSDRDQRITLLEACRYGSIQTESWHQSQGILATEHALIDGNGDRFGERLSDLNADYSLEDLTENEDLFLSHQIILIDESFPDSAPRHLVQEYLDLLQEIKTLIQEKENFEERNYYQQLEVLFIRAAQVHKKIRSADHP